MTQTGGYLTNELPKVHGIYFKRLKFLLIKRYKKFTEEQKTQVRIMLDVSTDLSTAYFMKEDFLNIPDIQDIEKRKKELDDWISWAKACPIERFNKCAYTVKIGMRKLEIPLFFLMPTALRKVATTKLRS